MAAGRQSVADHGGDLPGACGSREGVRSANAGAGGRPGAAREIGRHESIALTEIAGGVLRYSNNLSAELIGLAASQALTGRTLSLEDSAMALAAWWKLRLADVDWTGFFVENHSGLSSKSRSTPRQIVAMLEEAAGSLGGAEFHDLLRSISWKGVKGSARVKTGTMSYGRGLAGYIDTSGGKRLAFAIFVNDAEERAALDAAFDPHVRAIDPEVPALAGPCSQAGEGADDRLGRAVLGAFAGRQLRLTVGLYRPRGRLAVGGLRPRRARENSRGRCGSRRSRRAGRYHPRSERSRSRGCRRRAGR